MEGGKREWVSVAFPFKDVVFTSSTGINVSESNTVPLLLQMNGHPILLILVNGHLTLLIVLNGHPAQVLIILL